MSFYYNHSSEKKILTDAMDVCKLRKLVVQTPDMFNLDTIPSYSRAQLLSADPKFYGKYIEFCKLTQADQVDIALAAPGKFASKINWIEMNISQRNKIAHNRPSWFQKYKIPLEQLSGDSWLSLIRYRAGVYTPLFLKHVITVTNKTEVRKVFKRKTSMIRYLTIEQVEQSALSAKEWMLLAGSREFTRLKRPPTFSNDVLEWLESELSIEVLSGTSTNSKPLKRARAKAGV